MTLSKLIRRCKTDVFIYVYLNKEIFDSGYARVFYNLYRYDLHKYRVMMIDCDEDGLHIYVEEDKWIEMNRNEIQNLLIQLCFKYYIVLGIRSNGKTLVVNYMKTIQDSLLNKEEEKWLNFILESFQNEKR